MRKTLFIIFFVCLFFISSFSQEAKLIDRFERIACGDFMARMDNIAFIFKENPNSKIYLIYYGGRFRRSKAWDAEMQKQIITGIEFAHKNDGLNYAKAIPMYIKDELSRYKKVEKLLTNTVLVDGGYLEDITIEVWLVPNGSNLPKTTPKLLAKQINFGAKTPIKTPRYSLCYT